MGGASAYEFTVEVTAVSETVLVDITIERGCNAVIYLGNIKVNSLSLDGKDLTDYKVENYTLTISADLLKMGDNLIVINGNKTVIVTLV